MSFITFPEARQSEELDVLFRQMQERDDALRRGDHRSILNTESGLFAKFPNQLKSAAAAAFIGLATPLLKKGADDFREIGLSFLGMLGGTQGEKEQIRATQELIEYQETGQIGSKGLNALVLADAEKVLQITRNIRQHVDLTDVQVSEPKSRFSGFNIFDILAPRMSKDQKAGAIITKQKNPVPNIRPDQTGVKDYLDDQARLRNEGINRVPEYVGAMDTDATAYNGPTRAEQQAYEAASRESNSNKREELINIINSANTFNENVILEDRPDEFLYDLQEQRMLVNQRPVPSYSTAANRMNGVYKQVTVSPLYV